MSRYFNFARPLLSPLLLAGAWFAQAAPQNVKIDGSLFDASGLPVSGSKDIQVRAYDAASGGTLLWTSAVYTPSVSGGRFSIALDASAGSPSLKQRISDLGSSGQLWFEIDYDTGTANGTMNSAVTVRPRIRAKGALFATAAAQADTLSGVSASAIELNRLIGITADVQMQINSLSGVSGQAYAKLAKGGDTMTGDLGLQGSQITNTDRVLYLDTSRRIASSSATSTHINYLSTVSANVQTQINSLIAADAGKADTSTLSGISTWIGQKADQSALIGVSATVVGVSASVVSVSASVVSVSATVQSKAAQSDLTSVSAQAYAKLAKGGDTMTGDLGLLGSQITNTDRVLYLDSSRRIASSSATSTHINYLSTVSANVQTQINSLLGVSSSLAASIAGKADSSTLSGISTWIGQKADQSALTGVSATLVGVSANAYGKLDRGGDTMSGNLGLSGGQIATLDRALYIDSSRRIASSSASSAELNYLAGLTANVQTQLNSSGGSNRVLKAGDTMTGSLNVNGGQIFATQNVVVSGVTADFNTGNVQVLQSVGASAIVLNNMRDGGSYTVVVTDSVSRQYTFTNCTNSYFVPSNDYTYDSTRTVYTILKTTESSQTRCYISWIRGFQ